MMRCRNKIFIKYSWKIHEIFMKYSWNIHEIKRILALVVFGSKFTPTSILLNIFWIFLRKHRAIMHVMKMVLKKKRHKVSQNCTWLNIVKIETCVLLFLPNPPSPGFSRLLKCFQQKPFFILYEIINPT